MRGCPRARCSILRGELTALHSVGCEVNVIQSYVAVSSVPSLQSEAYLENK